MSARLRERIRQYGIDEWKRSDKRHNLRSVLAAKLLVAACWPHSWYWAGLYGRYRCDECGSQIDNAPLFYRAMR